MATAMVMAMAMDMVFDWSTVAKEEDAGKKMYEVHGLGALEGGTTAKECSQ